MSVDYFRFIIFTQTIHQWFVILEVCILTPVSISNLIIPPYTLFTKHLGRERFFEFSLFFFHKKSKN